MNEMYVLSLEARGHGTAKEWTPSTPDLWEDNNGLSFTERGMLAFLLSKPFYYRFSLKMLSKEGRLDIEEASLALETLRKFSWIEEAP